MNLYMFRTVPLSIIRSFSLYAQQWYMSYSLRAVPSWSCSQTISKLVWLIPLLCVQWKTPDDGQRNCPKHAETYSKNKFEKLVHPVGFVIRKITRCTSHERQIRVILSLLIGRLEQQDGQILRHTDEYYSCYCPSSRYGIQEGFPAVYSSHHSNYCTVHNNFGISSSGGVLYWNR